ncbi:phosphopantetheine binding protein [Chitinophaga niastensis]|uniref:Phosphopantetheine binding protein n=1 Tax=Chitinophaga niastensis TaxID=536980 RepID=A0A2P8HPN0_CHINA|nr:beta-ketoacyl synthase N-terminal-like domain-containing protein [Chitinophaga niastensis]PSL48190.1 phosphopantetheine binding protein [Chitinophaga niastensis]
MQDQFFINIHHPVLGNHRVYGQSLLPGLAYIDMMYQFFREHGYEYTALELRHLSIYHPLIVSEDTAVVLDLICTEKEPGQWQVLMEGSEHRNGITAAERTRYATAIMQQTAPALFTEMLDLSITTADVQQISLDEIYAVCSSREMVHTGLMKTTGNIYRAATVAVMEIAADNSHTAEIMFHPALIDTGAIGAAVFLEQLLAGEERLFLPLFYESFQASALLQDQCYVRILTSTVQRKEELITFTLEFFNVSGQKVAELKNFSSKLVRGTGLMENNVVPYPVAETVATPVTGIDALTGAEALVRRLLAVHLKKPAMRIDVHAGYYEMGLDSAGLLELVQSIEKELKVILSPTLLFEYTTIASLAQHLGETYPHCFLQGTALPATAKVTAEKEMPPSVATVGVREDIAIIAMEGRFPGAANVKAFWQNLQQGKDCITKVPADRWNLPDYFEGGMPQTGKTLCEWGGFLDDVTMFDPLFFNISPREAASMHPNERLFLETVWHLFEHAGYTRAHLREKYQAKVGVFAGAMHQHYQPLPPDVFQDAILALHSFSAIVNRVSYFFNLQGPSIAVDTMCSSALVALHMACESLANGDCQLAIAGGVNLSLNPSKYIGLGIAQMLGSHVNSRSFSDGDGYLPAEAVGAVLLKPLSAAIRDKDQVLAVIRATATNHGGHSSGYSIPNLAAQVQLMEDNFKKSGVHPDSISYVEAAANGSALGDAIEMTALSKVFAKAGQEKNRCAIGAVKSGIGHAEAASGITQLIKTVLQLHYRQLVPSITTQKLNPKIDFEGSPFYLQQQLADWNTHNNYPRRACVSAFGAGGSNASVILEEYTGITGKIAPVFLPAPQIVVLSAKTQMQLEVMAQQLQAFVKEAKEIHLPDMAYTLQTGREAMEYRLALVVTTIEDVMGGLHAALRLIRKEEVTIGVPVFVIMQEGERAGIGSLFSGELAETVTRALMAENNPEKLAHYWVKGGVIPWEELHKGISVQKILLPVYAFEKRRCWIEGTPVITSHVTLADTVVEQDTESVNTTVMDILGRLLGLSPSEIDVNKPLEQYGFDSILQVQLMQQLQSQISADVETSKLITCTTAAEICSLHSLSHNGHPQPTKQVTQRRPASNKQFPELVHLNQVNEGRPVFWFHPVQGGVESYITIAGKCNRPFYGVQARGWMTDRTPLQGVQAMAAYYIHALQSVQPAGPYDLGGYSLGGILAYEITRQLQELGHTINSIVMLDAVYTSDLQMGKINNAHKTGILQAVNMMLFSAVLHHPEKIHETLIHRDAVDMTLPDEQYWEQMMVLANERGLTKTTAQMHQLVAQSAKVQRGYDMDSFSVQPLPDPDGVSCYFFRNSSGLFYGELSPYFTVPDTGHSSLDHLNYWEEWERQLPHFHMMEAASPNHMMMLSDPASHEAIVNFCEQLYAGKEVLQQLHVVME